MASIVDEAKKTFKRLIRLEKELADLFVLTDKRPHATAQTGIQIEGDRTKDDYTLPVTLPVAALVMAKRNEIERSMEVVEETCAALHRARDRLFEFDPNGNRLAAVKTEEVLTSVLGEAAS